MPLNSAECLRSDLSVVEERVSSLCKSWEVGSSTLTRFAHTKALISPSQEALLSPGKRMRPLLCLWAYRNAENNFRSVQEAKEGWSSALQVGLACEVLHSASLVIDDIQDGSLERRGKPTVFKRFGVPVAINAGNWMYFEAQRMLAELNLDRESISMLRDCHEGQALDLSTALPAVVHRALDTDPSQLMELYNEIAAQKTARLMKFGAFSAASRRLSDKAGASPSTSLPHQAAELIASYGHLYQRVDDMRNLSADLSASKVHEDLASLRNFVMILFVSLLSRAERTRMKRAFDAGQLVRWTSRHPEFPIAIAEAKTQILGDMGVLERQARRVCVSDRSWNYLSQVLHTPLSHLVMEVAEETAPAWGNPLNTGEVSHVGLA